MLFIERRCVVARFEDKTSREKWWWLWYSVNDGVYNKILKSRVYGTCIFSREFKISITYEYEQQNDALNWVLVVN